MKSIRRCVACGLVGASLAASLMAEGSAPKVFEVHGFLAQGWMKSSGNNYFGHSLDRLGSVAYHELGVNGSLRLSSRLSVSAQLLARKAGNTEDDTRVDFAFVDWRAIDAVDVRAGVRLGRVKNPLGLYNETRDVFATRPSILLPETVYSEGVGIRELLFSSDGGQLYGEWDHRDAHTSFKLNLARSMELSRKTRANFLSGPLTFTGVTIEHFRLENPLYAQVSQDWSGATRQLALSYVRYGLRLDFDRAFGLPPLLIDEQRLILSGALNLERWTVASELSLNDFGIGLSPLHDRAASQGLYLQLHYRVAAEWTCLARYDVARAESVMLGGSGSAHVIKYRRDFTAGVSWSPTPAWRLMLEGHEIRGTGGIPGLDNIGRKLAPRTRVLAFMVGFRF